VLVLLLTIVHVMELSAAEDSFSRFALELEAGPVWQTKNTVQVPNTDEGTRFSLVDLIGTGPYPAARLYFSWNVNERHGFRLLLAPLSIEDSGVLESPVDFSGEHFDAGVPTDAIYQFNSWRITYRYRFHRSDRWIWWIGFTAKIRDAKIQVDQPGTSAKETDIGFVPLLYLRGRLNFTKAWYLVLDLDALAGGPGRAEDISLKLYYDINKRWSLSAGYRTIEGGADVEEVYNFAWLNYIVFSAKLRF
jgi:hypothetical protein